MNGKEKKKKEERKKTKQHKNKEKSVGVGLFLYFCAHAYASFSSRKSEPVSREWEFGYTTNMPVVMATTVRRIKHEMKIRRSQSMTPSK